MDSFLTSNSPDTSLNTSFDYIITHPSELRNSREIRTSQSLYSINNDPNASFIEELYNSLTNYKLPLEIESCLEKVEESDFDVYLSKIFPNIKKMLENETRKNENSLEKFTPENCYELIPEEFFDTEFDVFENLDYYTEKYTERLNYLLDFADLSIFSVLKNN